MRDTLIPEKQRKTKEFIAKKLENVSNLCAHIDLWSSKSMDGYLGLSVSGIDKNFVPFKAYLACCHVQGSHTGKRILSEYEDIVQNWGLQNKVILPICFSKLIRLSNNFILLDRPCGNR